MKKTIQFFIVAFALLATLSTAHAAKVETVKTEKIVAHKVIKKIGGEMGILIVVTDMKGYPVKGVNIAIPCTGMPNQQTDEKGSAFFETKEPKECDESPAFILGAKGEEVIKVSSGQSYEVTLPIE
jgi:hypothetical protein